MVLKMVTVHNGVRPHGYSTLIFLKFLYSNVNLNFVQLGFWKYYRITFLNICPYRCVPTTVLFLNVLDSYVPVVFCSCAIMFLYYNVPVRQCPCTLMFLNYSFPEMIVPLFSWKTCIFKPETIIQWSYWVL